MCLYVSVYLMAFFPPLFHSLTQSVEKVFLYFLPAWRLDTRKSGFYVKVFQNKSCLLRELSQTKTGGNVCLTLIKTKELNKSWTTFPTESLSCSVHDRNHIQHKQPVLITALRQEFEVIISSSQCYMFAGV